MRVIVRLPETEVELQLSAYEEETDGLQIWSIFFPSGDKFCIHEHDGGWQALGENRRGFSYDYIQELGRAIKPTNTDMLINEDDDITDNEIV